MKNKFLKKSSILIFGELVTKVLGIIYLFPLYRISSNIGALSADLYIPYAFILIFASIGINNVMTDEVSKYSGIKDQKNLKKSLHNGLIFSLGTGVIASIFLFVCAYPIMHSLSPHSNYLNEAVTGTKQLAFAVVLFAITNFIRAVLMGFGDVTEVSISYIGEQLIRVIILIAGVYYVISLNHENLAATIPVFTASTIFSIVGTLIYFIYIFIKKGYLNYFLETKFYISSKTLRYITYNGLIYFINGLFITAFDQYDIFMMYFHFHRLGYTALEIENLKGILFNWSSKLVQVPIGLASAFFSMLIHSFNNAKDQKQARYESLKILKIIYMYAIICVALFFIFGNDLYSILYEKDIFGGHLLKIQSLIIPFYVMQAAISIYILLNKRNQKVFISNIILLVIKPVLNLIFIFTLGRFLNIYLFIITSITTLTISIYILFKGNKSLFNFKKNNINSYLILTTKVFGLVIFLLLIQKFFIFSAPFLNILFYSILTFPILILIILKELKK